MWRKRTWNTCICRNCNTLTHLARFASSRSAYADRPTAVITGASKGFGQATTEKFLSKGWNVCMISRSGDLMKNIASQFTTHDSRVKIIETDVLKANEIQNICQDIKIWSNDNINLLFNNIGAVRGGLNVENATSDDIDWNMSINVKPTFFFTQHLLSSLKNAAQNNISDENGVYDGCIVNTSSTAASIADPLDDIYSMCKAAINQFTKLNALRLAPFEIRVNAIAPAVIATPIHKTMGMNEQQLNDFYEHQARITPLKRIGTSKDVAEMVYMLANKDKTGMVTGQIWTLCGGRTLVGANSANFLA